MTTTEQLHPIIGLKPYYAQLIFNKKKKERMEAAIKTKNDIILLLLEELCLCMTTTEQLHPIIGLKPYHAQLTFNKKRKKEEWKQQLKLKTILLLEELCLCMTTTEQL